MNSICLAYSAVHEIFQLAAAAEAIGELDALLCTMVDKPGKTGAWLAKAAHIPSARPLGLDLLPAEKIDEYPWPVLAQRTALRLFPKRRRRHYWSNAWFDLHAARWLCGRKNARLFVGAETCALRSLRQARKMGMIRVLDVPGIPSTFLQRETEAAAAELGIATASIPSIDMPMHERKMQEMAEADVLLACSDMQRQKLAEEGFAPREKIQVTPLWTDVDFWSDDCAATGSASNNRLRVIYAGSISLRKGVPYLLRAMERIRGAADLTLVGSVSPELAGVIAQHPHSHHSHAAKERLRELYHAHDVLVTPSLGDSFGFVVLEAMAAGLPVIASANCGAPLPDESWRVPARDADAIAARLMHYHDNRDALQADSLIARDFARQFRPERYRAEVGRIFRRLLDAKVA